MINIAEALDEVVVVGYGTQKKASVTGSVATVRSDQLTLTPQSNVGNALIGQVPGLVSVQSSGEPGYDNARLNIRGFGSPLVIVDGVERGFNELNPEEVESITILKDASAAIYGVRAGNGVILVTTKRGTNKKPKFTFNNSYSVQGITKYPDIVNSGQYTELVLDGELNDGVPLGRATYTREDVQKYYDQTDPQYPDTDWQDYSFQKWSPQYDANLTVAGGSENIKYFALLGYMHQEGMYKTGDNRKKRYNFRSNIDAEIAKGLHASISIGYINNDLQGPQRNTETAFQDLFVVKPTMFSVYPDPTKLPSTGSTNPVINGNIDLGGYRRNLTSTINLDGKLEYEIPFVDGLKARAFYSLRQNNIRSNRFVKQPLTYNYDFESDTYTPDYPTIPTSLMKNWHYDRKLTGNAGLDYNKSFGKHNVTGLVLFESVDYFSNFLFASRNDFDVSTIDYLFASGSDGEVVNDGGSEYGQLSWIGRATYAYDNRYLFNITFRADADSKFPPDNRWGYFPGISAGWRISEETFMSNADIVDELKLRLSYALSGDNAGLDYNFLSGYSYYNTRNGQQIYLFDETIVYPIASLGIPARDLTWGEITTANAGLDFSLFSNRLLYGEFDAFYRLRDGIIATKSSSTSVIAGANLPQENINSQSTRGLELKLGHRGHLNDFRYSAEGNISWNRTKWEYKDEPEYIDPDDIRLKQQTGKWTNIRYGYMTDGLFQTQEEIDNYLLDQNQKGNKGIRPGDIKYIDRNGDGVLDERDRAVIGLSGNPEIMYGVNLSANYKGLNLSMVFQGALRKDIVVAAQRYTDLGMVTMYYENRWTEGVETPESTDENPIYWSEPNTTDARFPRAASSSSNFSGPSDYWLVNGAYFRLKVLSFGYSLPKRLINPVGVDNVRVYISGINLFTLSELNKWDLDPEAPDGTEGFYYPQQRTFSFGINLSF